MQLPFQIVVYEYPQSFETLPSEMTWYHTATKYWDLFERRVYVSTKLPVGSVRRLIYLWKPKVLWISDIELPIYQKHSKGQKCVKTQLMSSALQLKNSQWTSSINIEFIISENTWTIPRLLHGGTDQAKLKVSPLASDSRRHCPCPTPLE